MDELNEVVQSLPSVWCQTVSDSELHEGSQDTTADAKVNLNRFKVLLVGDSAVGKTSCRKHLMGEKVPTDHISTDGIETFEVESYDVTSDWKKRNLKCNDLDKSITWWLSSIYPSVLGDKFNQIGFFISVILLYCFVFVLVLGGFTTGFFLENMIFGHTRLARTFKVRQRGIPHGWSVFDKLHGKPTS